MVQEDTSLILSIDDVKPRISRYDLNKKELVHGTILGVGGRVEDPPEATWGIRSESFLISLLFCQYKKGWVLRLLDN